MPTPHVDNRVVVRVWTSKVNTALHGEGVGHISLEFGDTYMSLWPQEADFGTKGQVAKRDGTNISFWKKPLPSEGLGILATVKPAFQTSFADDCRAEGHYDEEEQKHYDRFPEATVCLYSLRTDAILARFSILSQTRDAIRTVPATEDEEAHTETVSEHVTSYAGIGDNVMNGYGGHSCASLVYDLLKAGGLYELLPKSRSCGLYKSQSPDALLTAVFEAKKKELALYPETSNEPFVFDKESKVPDKIEAAGIASGIATLSNCRVC